MADKEISNLPKASALYDSALFPAYIPGASSPAQSVTGAQLKAFAEAAAKAVKKGDKGDPGDVSSVNGVKPDSKGNVNLTLGVLGAQPAITGSITSAFGKEYDGGRILITSEGGYVTVTENIGTEELSRLSGITGNIQQQLDGKAPSDYMPDINKLGAQPKITGAATTITDQNLEGGKVVVTTNGGKITNAKNVTTELLSFLIGLTGSIQQQLDEKAPLGHDHENSGIVEFPLSEDLTAENKSTIVRYNASTTGSPHDTGDSELKNGICIVSVSESGARSLLAIPSGGAKVFFRQKKSAGWDNWKTVFDSAGGTLNGNVMVQTDDAPRFSANNTTTSRFGRFTAENNNWLSLLNYLSATDNASLNLGSEGFVSLANILQLKTPSGTYDVLHRGNKPTGSYTGNGSSASRTIEIGGNGALLFVNGGYRMALVGPFGAICMLYSSTSVVALIRDEAKFLNGVLTMATTSSYLNDSRYTYNYEVL